MENKDHKDIDFIASRYRDGLFRTENALNRIRPRRRRGWTPLHTAAAIAAGLVLTATAALVVHHNYGIESRDRMESGINVTDDPDELVVRVIDFEDAPLTQVVAEIRIVYGAFSVIPGLAPVCRGLLRRFSTMLSSLILKAISVLRNILERTFFKG